MSEREPDVKCFPNLGFNSKIAMKSLLTTFAFLCVTGACQASLITINDIDPNTGTYSFFNSIANDVNSFTLSRTFDFDGGGTDDTLSFDLVRTTYASGTISGADVTVGTVNGGGNTTNWYSNFGNAESIQFEIQNITYTSGEMDGTTAVFDGFQNITRVDFASGAGAGTSIDYLLHTGPVGSTTITSTGTSLDLTSGGSSSSIFLTAESGAGGIRLRDLDLQFSTVAVPEPSSAVLLGFGCCLLLTLRRRSRSLC